MAEPGLVVRRAVDIRDGDEWLLRSPIMDEGDDVALVVEKTLDEDGRVTLMVSLPPDAALTTHARPSEMGDPFDA